MPTTLRDILYVDDEPNNLFVFEAAFEDEFRVHVAHSAAAALGILEAIPIPVVVADQRMPEMTGVEMFAVLRRRYPHIQRIILSGYTESQAIIDAVNEGQVFQFVQKPWERADLHTVLRRALDAHDLATQNSRLAERLAMVERMANLGQTAAEIAHEMGNQLMLLPLVELIEDEYSGDPQLQELAGMARQTHEHLTTLIDEIKHFVRQSARGGPSSTGQLQLRPLNLADCVRDLLSFLRFHQTIPVTQIRFCEPSDTVNVLGDSFKLQQVLVNLLANASDAIADQRGGQIDIAMHSSPHGASLCVSDNGCGIAPDQLNRIWESFYTTKGERGTGLGLDVARNVMQAHGGSIVCESEQGSGTRFILRFPPADQDPSRPRTFSLSPTPSEGENEATQQERDTSNASAHSSSSRRA